MQKAIAWIVGAALLFGSRPGNAAQFVTIADATINLDHIEYIEPNFCQDMGNIGSCGFVIVFSGGNYSVSVKNEGYGATHSARDRLEVNVVFIASGVAPDGGAVPKTQAEALKRLRVLRDLLPK